MKFVLKDLSGDHKGLPKEIEIDTIEDLKKLEEGYGENTVIVNFMHGTITIYDDFLE